MSEYKIFLGCLFFEDGWHGGLFSVLDSVGKETPLLKLVSKKDKLKVEIDGNLYPIKLCDRTGVDDDHGHEYHWTNIGIMLKTKKPADLWVNIPCEFFSKDKKIKIYEILGKES